jgi:copper chaperone CopZ
MEIVYAVPGVSCEHCRNALTSELSRVDGVDAVEVDLEGKLVRVHGEHLDDVEIRAAIGEAGYEVA